MAVERETQQASSRFSINFEKQKQLVLVREEKLREQ